MAISLNPELEAKIKQEIDAFEQSEASMQELDSEELLFHVWEIMENAGVNPHDIAEYIDVHGSKIMSRNLLARLIK